MEWLTYFLQQQDSILSVIGHIISRMAELKTLSNDPFANQSTIDGAAAEFMDLQSQLALLRTENLIRLFHNFFLGWKSFILHHRERTQS